MNILLVQNMLYVPSIGGANKASRLLVEGLAEREHVCRVVAPAFGSHGPQSRSEFQEALAARGIRPSFSANGAEVFHHQGVEVHAVADITRLRDHVAAQIREFKPTWTMVSSQDPGQVLLEAALSESGGRVVYFVQAPWDLPFGSDCVVANPHGTELIRRTAGIITVSDALRRYIQRWSGLESSIIYPPVYGAGPFPHLGDFTNPFVTIVNPSAVKGISVFLALAEKFPDVQFAAVPTWATTTSDRTALERQPNVKLLDPFDDIDELFAQTRVLLVPSLWTEGFGLIVVEAMLRGIPVIASNTGGLPEAKLGLDYVLPVRPIERYEERFDDRHSPVPIVPEQDLAPWEDALRELLSDRARYERLSARSREAAQAFVSRIGVGPFEEYLEKLGPKHESSRNENGSTESKEDDASRPDPLPLLDNMSSDKRALLALRALKLKKKGTGGATARGKSIPRRSISDTPPPLSFAQQRLWLLDQLQPDNTAYNLPAFVRLKGRLNVNALEQTFNEVIRRHEVLRTSFSMMDGQPVQLIADHEPLTLEPEDLSQLPHEEREAELQRLAVEEARRLFDLAQGPLVRIRLLRLGAEDHTLFVTIHHIVSDEWSIGILIREVCALYGAYSHGQLSPLPELPVQYADYADWQRQWLQGEVLDEQLQYWRAQLAGAPALLELPTDKPRPAVQTYNGAHHSLIFDAKLSHSLQAFSQREGATLFMTLLAAFQTLLSRYSGQEDILVGTPIAGRNRAEVEPLIGFFANTLVLRTHTGGDPSFSQLLARVKEMALGAYAHQDVPFEMLVDELQPERRLSHSPLFQVMFTMLNTPRGTVEVEGLEFSPLRGEVGTAKFDLSLAVMERADGLLATLEHNTDLFEAESIRRMMQHFIRLLSAVVDEPQQRLSQLPLLSAEERHQLTVEWNQTRAEYSRDHCVHQLFEEQAARTPDQIALKFGDEQLTYRQLNERANQLAHHLRTLGVGAEALVAILMERSIEMVISLLAVMKAGGGYVPLDPAYPQDRLNWMIEDSGARVLLTQDALREQANTAGIIIVSIDGDWQEIGKRAGENPTSNLIPDNAAYVIYTSGSTGRPKGVQLQHRSVVNFLSSMQQRPGLSAEDVLLAVTTLSFDIAGLELYLPLITGARTIITSREEAASPVLLQQLLTRNEVSIMQATPATWRMLIESGWASATETDGDEEQDSVEEESSGRKLKVLCGGEALSSELAAQLVERAEQVWNLYGPTETTIWSSLLRVSSEAARRAALVSIGHPINNTQLYVLDSELQSVPIGVAGELYIGGDGVARGYLNRAELTAERFVPDPFSTDAGERLYRTGDVARYLASGEVEYLGRSDQQVKVRGYRIEVGEIEAVLSEHSSVREAVVVAREDTPGDKRLVAYVVAQEETALSVSELRPLLSGKLPEYMIPSSFVVLDQLPLTPNGKVNRRALPAPGSTREELDSVYVAPRNPVEQLLAEIWQQSLRLSAVGVQDNFFQLGGHSLLAMRVIARVREVFAVEIPLRRMFEDPTVAGLAQSIESARRVGPELQVLPILPVAREPLMPLSFAQQRLWFLDQLEPGSSFYNVPAAVRLRGQLDIDALEQTLNEIVRRHETLRTTFKIAGEQPAQVINPAQTLTLPVVDLRELPEEERESEAWQLTMTETQLPFDLARGPLVRARLLRLEEEEYVLMLTMHHIISDDWSIGVLIREMAALYIAYSQGQPSPLSELPIQYVDYAAWQRQWLQGEVLDEQLSYWREQLAGAPALLELPTDRPLPPVQTYHGAQLSLMLSEELTTGLKALGQREGLTLFMTLLAAFQALLSRYSGQEDILVGTPIAGRNRAEVEPLIGFFINTLVLRTKVKAKESFRELLRRVREVALGAYTHQDVPFEMLVDELQPERSLSHSPLFQVIFTMLNAPRDEFEVPGLRLSPVRGEITTAKFQLTFSVMETTHGLRGTIKYNTDLFEAESIEHLLRHFEHLLTSALADPDQRLSQLPLLSPAERHQLTVEWNQTRADYSKERCIHQLFEEQAARTPDQIALKFGDEQLTYAELNVRANQLGHYLRELGVGPETLVAIMVERSIEMVVAVLGVLKAGGGYVPLDPAYPQERLSFMLKDTETGVLLTQQHLTEQLPEHRAKTIYLDTQWDEIAKRGGQNPASNVTPENVAYVIYTSGSTGKPKGVSVTHANVGRLLSATEEWCRFNERDVWTLFHSYAFDFSVWELWGALCYGGRLVIVPYRLSRSPESFYRLLIEEQVTVLNQTPSAFRQLMPVEEPADGSQSLALRLVIFGGEALELQSLRPWFDRHGDEMPQLVNMYGITETTVHVTYRPLTVADMQNSVGSVIGRPIPDLRAYVLDAELEPVPIGVAGELYVGGDGVARGYLNRPELTAERFVPDRFNTTAGARLYRTGDVARYLSGGDLEYLGRSDQQVKVRGYRIEVGEIEAVLNEHPSVREAVVVAREEREGDKRLVAYVVAEGETGVSVSELRAHVAARVPEYMVPGVYVEVSQMPLTPNGKVDRRALPAPDQSRPALAVAYHPPQTPLEELLARMWQQSLGVENVGRDDNFFELGGDSIRAAVFINKLQEELDAYIYVVAIFDAPTIAALSAYLTENYREAIARWSGEAVEAQEEDLAVGRAVVDEVKLEEFRRLIPHRVRRIPATATSQQKNRRAIFILSPPRSGSTLLRVMLGGHPRLFAPPELELLSFDTLQERSAAFEGRDSFWLEGVLRALMQLHDWSVDEAREQMQRYQEQALSTREFYRILQDALGDRLLVDKTPSYALDPEVLARAEEEFDEAVYLHLIRHPHAMIRSFEEAHLDQVFFRYSHPFSRTELAELIWLTSHRNIRRFLSGVPGERQMRVVFEELVREPRTVMQEVCRVLGVEWEEAMLEPYQEKAKRMTDGIHPAGKMVGDVKFHEHGKINEQAAERWREESVASRALSEQTWEEAERLGYEREGGSRRATTAARRLGRLKRANREEELPLSYAQQRLWFLDQLEPGSAVYNIAAAVRLSGELNTAALEQALSEIIRRHESLRTTFASIDGQPVQKIHPPSPLMLEVVDLSTEPESEREAQARRLVGEEAQRGFDLEQGPLVRARLLRLGEEDYVLLWTMHHIISDGWSLGILMQEVATLYKAFSMGQESPFEELPVQYADYAHWQREWLQDEVLEQQLAYWKEQLSGAPALLELPTDHPRHAIQTHRGAMQGIQLSAESSEGLKAMSQREGVTLFMTLLAAFQTLLSRYSGQEDILVGTPIAGRNRTEVEPLIGFFANTLVLRTKVKAQESFRELLRHVREVALGAYAHQDVPFEKLVEDLQPERSLSQSPLFQVMFMLQNAPREDVELPGLRIKQLGGENVTAKFDLTLAVIEGGRGLTASVEYNTDLFEAESIKRLLQHFEHLLTSALADPDQRLSQLPLLSAEERHQLTVEWNSTVQAYPHEHCLHQLFEEQVARTPDQIALKFGDEQLTYAELNVRANKLAHFLREMGVGPETLVAIMVERSVEMLVSVLGVLKAGGGYVPLDPAYPQERLNWMIEDSGVRVILTQESLRERVSGSNAVLMVSIDREWDVIRTESEENPTSGVDTDNLAYVIYTSGSTGRPKGVQLQHRSVVNFLSSMQQRPGLCAEDALLAVTTLSFDIAGLELYLPLITGASIVLASREMATNPLALKRELESGQVSVMQATPATWRMLIEAGWEGRGPDGEGRGNAEGSNKGARLGQRLKVLCGGEALSSELASQLVERAEEVWNLYGPTETTIWSSLLKVTVEAARRAALVSIGRPITNTQLYVLDAELQPVPIGVSGELYIGGDGVARGYLNRAELTAERFVPDPFSTDAGARLYRTGDVARYLASGEVEYLGRSDQQVKVRGYRIEVGEIEAVLSEHEGIREAVVVAREDTPGDKRLVAYFVREGEEQVSVNELRAHVGARVPEYMVPGVYVEVAEMPLTPNGKVDRRALPAPEQSRAEMGQEYVEPRTEVEETVAGIWAEVLGVERVGVHDNFFHLGGHSLLAMQVLARIRKAFQVEVPLRPLFESPTVETLAAAIIESQNEQKDNIATAITKADSVDESQLLTNLDLLSEAEMDSLLNQMLVEAEPNQ